MNLKKYQMCHKSYLKHICMASAAAVPSSRRLAFAMSIAVNSTTIVFESKETVISNFIKFYKIL